MSMENRVNAALEAKGLHDIINTISIYFIVYMLLIHSIFGYLVEELIFG